MEKLSYAIIMCFVVIPMTSAYFLFPRDPKSEERVRQYIFIKGIVYLILAFGITIYDLAIRHSYSPTTLLTICISLFEGFQILAQELAYRNQKKADAIVKEYQRQTDPFLKNVEKLFGYCSAQLASIRDSHETVVAKQLAYEQVYDYLKYYYCANRFLELFKKYINGVGELTDIDVALCELKADLELTVTTIVKIPKY